MELVLVLVNKVLLRIDELDDDDALDEVEDAEELELLMLDILEVALLLLEDDCLLVLAEKLKLDEVELVAWLRLLDAEEDVDEDAELELATDELDELDKIDEVDQLDGLDETDGLELAGVLDRVDEFVETDGLAV